MHGDLRLAKLIAPHSLVTDLGMGSTLEEAAGSCPLGTILAREPDLTDEQAEYVYEVALFEVKVKP